MINLISSTYPCLEHIFMAPKAFEPLKLYCYKAKSSDTEVPFLDLRLCISDYHDDLWTAKVSGGSTNNSSCCTAVPLQYTVKWRPSYSIYNFEGGRFVWNCRYVPFQQSTERFLSSPIPRSLSQTVHKRCFCCGSSVLPTMILHWFRHTLC